MAKRGRPPKKQSEPGGGEFPLLPCPFCGSARVALSRLGAEETDYFGECFGCHAMGPMLFGQEAAAEGWNTRAGDTANVSLPPAGAGGPDVG